MSLHTGSVDSISWAMAPTAEACREVRGRLEGWLDGVEPELVKTLLLLASELTILSLDGEPDPTGGPVEFSGARDATCVKLEAVRPAARYAFTGSQSDIRDVSLCLVDQLADRWGVKRTGRGTAWWVELDRWPL
jgi:hypothetical protein